MTNLSDLLKKMLSPLWFFIGAAPENLPDLNQAELTPGIKILCGPQLSRFRKLCACEARKLTDEMSLEAL